MANGDATTRPLCEGTATRRGAAAADASAAALRGAAAAAAGTAAGAAVGAPVSDAREDESCGCCEVVGAGAEAAKKRGAGQDDSLNGETLGPGAAIPATLSMSALSWTRMATAEPTAPLEPSGTRILARKLPTPRSRLR